MSPPALFARTWGEGPPVVLLHGLGASSRYWETLAEASSGYAGAAPDLQGFGRSPKPTDATYDAACHLEALVPLLSPGAVVVVHSTGAILAAALAAARPDAVRALLLLGLPAFGDEVAARRRWVASARWPASPSTAIRWPARCAWPYAGFDRWPPPWRRC